MTLKICLHFCQIVNWKLKKLLPIGPGILAPISLLFLVYCQMNIYFATLFLLTGLYIEKNHDLYIFSYT